MLRVRKRNKKKSSRAFYNASKKHFTFKGEAHLFVIYFGKGQMLKIYVQFMKEKKTQRCSTCWAHFGTGKKKKP